MHHPEDYSARWPYGVYLRLVRIITIFVILILPPFYIAINLYQPEILPTDLLFSLISVKQRSPFPTIIEVIILELVFEILREANLRAPRNLAGPLSVVAGILFGLVSVTTYIINPVLMLVIMVTALSFLTIPDYSASIGFRLIRY